MVYLKLVLTALFWGGTFIAGRSLAGHVSPFSAAFLRFLLASVLLGILVARTERRWPRLRTRDWGRLILLGMTGVFGYNVCFFMGLELIPASRASLIIANNPVAIALLSAWVFRERLGAGRILGILLSLTGALVVISKGDLSGIFRHGVGAGELLILGCVASWAAYSVVGKFVLRDLSPSVSVCGSALVGTAALFPAALAEGLWGEASNYRWQDWTALGYLGLFGTVFGFIWFYQGVRELGPARAGLFINFVPIFAITLAWLVLSEPVTWSLGIGALLVVTGVFVTNRGSTSIGSPRSRPPSDASVTHDQHHRSRLG